MRSRNSQQAKKLARSCEKQAECNRCQIASGLQTLPWEDCKPVHVLLHDKKNENFEALEDLIIKAVVIIKAVAKQGLKASRTCIGTVFSPREQTILARGM